MRTLYHFTRFVVVVGVLASTVAAQQSVSMPPAQTAEVFGQKIHYYDRAKALW